jgi:hypothetical protein
VNAEILIAIPVLGRPWRAASVYESATGATDVPHRVVFLVSPADDAQRAACVATGAEVIDVSWSPGPGDWARKINAAYYRSDEPWIFLGADDLCFCDGWASAALAVGEETDAGVVGTNDDGNPRVKAGQHSTHPLVRRSYVDALGTIDGIGILCEQYDHQYSDDELVETAKSRGAWAFARDAEVEHLHPYFGKAEMDETYEKALRATQADKTLFERRRHLWESA